MALQSHPDLTRADFERIPEIIRSPDRIPKSRTPQNLDAITYEKLFGQVTIYVEEVRTGRRVLAAKTMYKK